MCETDNEETVLELHLDKHEKQLVETLARLSQIDSEALIKSLLFETEMLSLHGGQ